MKKTIRAVAALALLLMLTPPLCARAESTGDPVPTATAVIPRQSDLLITGYRVFGGSTALASVKKGDVVSMELTLKSTLVKSSEITDASQLDISRLADSFSAGGTPVVSIESSGNDALSLRVKFPDCVYSGVGRAFRVLVGFPSLGVPYVQQEASILECVEYTQPVPTATPSFSVPAPTVRMARGDAPVLSAGDQALIPITFTNMGRATMDNAMATITTSESLLLLENAMTFPLGNLRPGETTVLTLRFQAAKTVTAQQQTIGAEVKFSYFNGEAPMQGTASDKLTLLAESTGKDGEGLGGPVPNIILQRYGYGEQEQVAAGSEFELSLDFLNTSDSKKIENLIMTLETGEGLSLRNSSNTFFYPTLGKGESKRENVSMQALSAAKSGSADVSVTFKYEYVENEKRSQVTLTQKLAIPLYQPDRFEVTLLKPDVGVRAGEDITVSLNYMNKGKSDVSNVQAECVSDAPVLGALQNLGNFEPGKSGSINFVVTPQEAGTLTCTLKVSYEDASAKQQVKEIPVSLTVEEAFDPMEGIDVIEEEPKSKLSVLWYIGGGVLLVGGGTAAFLARRKRKKNAGKSTYTWKEDEEA